MTPAHDPGEDPGRAGWTPQRPLPRLDADGMPAAVDPVAAGEPSGPTDGRAPGPTAVLPVLVALLGAVLTLWQLREVLAAVPAPARPRPMNGLVLTVSLALGGFSLTRVLQLLHLARSRRARAAAGNELAAAPRRLADAHSLHAVWVVGVAASVALMGALGVWSTLDGRHSGLEPGWPLLLLGGGAALLAHLAARATTAAWGGAVGAF